MPAASSASLKERGEAKQMISEKITDSGFQVSKIGYRGSSQEVNHGRKTRYESKLHKRPSGDYGQEINHGRKIRYDMISEGGGNGWLSLLFLSWSYNRVEVVVIVGFVVR